MAAAHLRAALSRILRSPSRLPTSHTHAPPLVLPHRFLRSSAAASSSGTFAAEDYLVSRCGLTRAQALKAAAKLSHLRSSAKRDAVLAYLESTLGIPAADVGRAVVVDPRFLCSNVEKTLAPRVAGLRDFGLSRDQIARLFPLIPTFFRSRLFRSNLEFWIAELGSFNSVLQVARVANGLLTADLGKAARTNLAFLRQLGLNISEIAGTTMYSPRLFSMNLELLKETVHRVEELGIDCGTGMFRHALAFFAVTDKEVVTGKIRLLQDVGFSKDDVVVILKKQPLVLALSEQKIRGNADFLMKDVGLEASYIARRPVLLKYSVERRLLPRHCLLKVVKEKGLVKDELDYYNTVAMSEKNFLKKFVRPFKNHVPGLTDSYASICLGKVEDGIA